MELGKSDFFELFPMVVFHFDCSVLFIVCSRFDLTSFSPIFKSVSTLSSKLLNVCRFYILIIQWNENAFEKDTHKNGQTEAEKEKTYICLVCSTVFNLPYRPCIPAKMDSLYKCRCDTSDCMQIIHMSDWYAHTEHQWINTNLIKSINSELNMKIHFVHTYLLSSKLRIR